jgi:hypothetical protein
VWFRGRHLKRDASMSSTLRFYHNQISRFFYTCPSQRLFTRYVPQLLSLHTHPRFTHKPDRFTVLLCFCITYNLYLNKDQLMNRRRYSIQVDISTIVCYTFVKHWHVSPSQAVPGAYLVFTRWYISVRRPGVWWWRRRVLSSLPSHWYLLQAPTPTRRRIYGFSRRPSRFRQYPRSRAVPLAGASGCSRAGRVQRGVAGFDRASLAGTARRSIRPPLGLSAFPLPQTQTPLREYGLLLGQLSSTARCMAKGGSRHQTSPGIHFFAVAVSVFDYYNV